MKEKIQKIIVDNVFSQNSFIDQDGNTTLPKIVNEIQELFQMEKTLIQIGYHRGEMDFNVSTLVGELTFERFEELRKIIPVTIYIAEDMWRRNNIEKVESSN